MVPAATETVLPEVTMKFCDKIGSVQTVEVPKAIQTFKVRFKISFIQLWFPNF
jgi:hypothetical protein